MQTLHPRQRVADGCRERGLAGDCGALHGQPSFQVIEDRGGMELLQLEALIRWRISGLLLDGVELCDPADGLLCEGGVL